MGRLPVGVSAGGDEFAPNWPYPDPRGVAIYRHHRADFAKLLIDRVIHCRRNATDPRQSVAWRADARIQVLKSAASSRCFDNRR
jgi:hypothetical protein